CQFELHVSEVKPAETLDGVERIGMRMTDFIQPRFVVKPACLDHKCLAVPLASRVPPPCRDFDFWTGPSVSEDLPKTVELLEKNNRQSRILNNFERNGRKHRSRYAFRPATFGRRSGTVSRETLLIYRQRRRPERNLLSVC